MTRTTDFDRDEMIDKAMNVFWNKGYEGTSMRDLMESTGLQKGSIYNSFESKENLFLLCLERYASNSRSFHYKEGDPGMYLQNFFRRLVKEGVDKKFVKGCLVMNSCLEFSGDEKILSRKAKILFTATEKNLRNVAEAFFNSSKSTSEIKKIQVNLVAAAFSIREISKFKKDKDFLVQIANNVLKEFNLRI